MKEYMKKNKMLMKEFFSVKSLKMLHQHFQESRLFYGMAVFLDIPVVIKVLETIKMKYFLGIFNLYDGINKNLLNLVLGIPQIEYLLFPRLMTILKKYFHHFNKRPILYDSLINAYESRLGEVVNIGREELKLKSYKYGIISLGKYYDIQVIDNYMNYRKLYFNYPDGRDLTVIKFLIKSHIFARYLFKKCLLCGDINEKDHLFCKCNNIELNKIKEKYTEKLINYLSEEEKRSVDVNNFYKLIIFIYFHPKEKKGFMEIFFIIKKFIFEIYLLLIKTRNKNKAKDKKDF